VVREDPAAVESWASLGLCLVGMGQEPAAVKCQQVVSRLTEAREKGIAFE
jgi:hypothetical protein